jgi:hypothetical protein
MVEGITSYPESTQRGPAREAGSESERDVERLSPQRRQLWQQSARPPAAITTSGLQSPGAVLRALYRRAGVRLLVTEHGVLDAGLTIDGRRPGPRAAPRARPPVMS